MPEFTSLAFDAQTQSAPLADVVLHVLAMHEYFTAHAAVLPSDRGADATERAVMVLNGYTPNDPVTRVVGDTIAEVLPLLRIAAKTRAEAWASTDMHERRRLRDLAHAAESEARRLVRHRITLEGSDL